MKTSAVLASVLFGAVAVAAPVDRRALAYKTEVVTETVVVYTTVYDDNFVAEATATSAGYFYEHSKYPSSGAAKPTASQASAYPSVSVNETKSSSTYVAPAPQSATPTPTPVASPEPATSAAYVAPAPVISSAAPAPVVSSAAPAPVVSSAAPAPAVSSAAPVTPVTTTSSGEFSGDFTIYNPAGGYGSCGTALQDTDMIVALSHEAMGPATYDYMTGLATNKWCGQKIMVDFKGKSVEATIMDTCGGCKGSDIDLSPAVWSAIGMVEITRTQGSWSKIA